MLKYLAAALLIVFVTVALLSLRLSKTLPTGRIYVNGEATNYPLTLAGIQRAITDTTVDK